MFTSLFRMKSVRGEFPRIFPVDVHFPVNVLIAVVIRSDMAEDLVGQRIPHPIDELAVLVVGNFGFIHVKALDGDGFGTLYESTVDILVAGPYK